jgi:hypothetical protein
MHVLHSIRQGHQAAGSRHTSLSRHFVPACRDFDATRSPGFRRISRFIWHRASLASLLAQLEQVRRLTRVGIVA